MENTTITFDQLVNKLNEKDGTNFDAGNFEISDLIQNDEEISFDNGITNVDFILADTEEDKYLYERLVKIVNVEDI